MLFPRARAWVAHLWTPPFASTSLRDRLWIGTSQVDEFVEAAEREGEREANRMATTGVTLARAAGWDAEPLVVRSDGGEGLRLAELAEKVDADLVLVVSRGLGGARAILGSVSDMVVEPRPVLVVPHPLLLAEYAALASGPVLVGSTARPARRWRSPPRPSCSRPETCCWSRSTTAKPGTTRPVHRRLATRL